MLWSRLGEGSEVAKVRVLTDRELMDEWFRYFGATRGVKLLGWCLLLGMTAPADANRSWVLAHGPMSPATRYRNVRELLQFQQLLQARGLDVESDEAEIETYERGLRAAWTV